MQRGVDCSGSFYAVEDEIEILDFQFFVIYYHTQKKWVTTNLHEKDNHFPEKKNIAPTTKYFCPLNLPHSSIEVEISANHDTNL